MESIKEKIRVHITEAVFEEKDKIKDDTLIFQEGYLDSMGFVMLLGFLEETFGVKPDDADLIEENFESINAIKHYVLQKQEA